MGVEYTLFFVCKVLPEYIEFVEKKYYKEDTVENLPKSYKDLIDICIDLDLPGYTSVYDLCGNNFVCSMYKNEHYHHGNLHEDYRKFMEDVIVPITSEITLCEVRCEEYYSMKTVYTDTELRHIPFDLKSKIKFVEHTYSDDGKEIIESRVVYKRSIKKIQFLDLHRAYGSKPSTGLVV